MLEKMDTATKKTQKIYVKLLNEGTDVCTPTEAMRLKKGLFMLLPTKDYDPLDEEWEFLPGSTVRCEEKTLSQGKVLVAVAQA